jgi:transcriptional regulator with XRE-family HTH domain
MGTFDAVGFYEALDATRRSKSLNWKQVADEAGISASTLTRMAQGKRPDVDGLAALVAWSGLEVDQFVRKIGAHRKPEPLAVISTYLRSDKQLSAQSAIALDGIIKAAYEQLRKTR